MLFSNTTNKLNNTLIINPYHGLGNRLRVIASAFSIAKATKKILVIQWVPCIHCDCYFNDLFENLSISIPIILVNYSINLSFYSNIDYYNYIDYEVESQKDKYINTNTTNNIYIKSYSILNHKYANTYFNDFFKLLKPTSQIQTIIDSVSLEKNTIAMHIRNGGGSENNDQQGEYDKLTNWTREEQEKMIKYRKTSNIDNFIIQIYKELQKDIHQTFFISTDSPENYEKIINMFGENRIKYIKRNVFDRSKEQIYYAVADIFTLVKCKTFYSSYWSSFSEIVLMQGLFDKHISSNNFNNEYDFSKEKISVVQCCKNRNENLVKSIKSYIDHPLIDDIVIVDWNSNDNVKKYLKKNNILSDKIKIIEVVNSIPWILSWAYNIGFLYAKNNKILKLDADYEIINKEYLFFLNKIDSNKYVFSFDWSQAKNKNEIHLNGFFYLTKNLLKTIGFFNQDILFYGWDDSELKKRITNHNIQILNIDYDFLYHNEHNDNLRLKNQHSNYNIKMDFYGFPLEKLINNPMFLILYNEMLCKINNKLFLEDDTKQLFKIYNEQNNYTQIIIPCNLKYDIHSNYNDFSDNNYSICKSNLFKKIKNYAPHFYLNINESDLHHVLCKKYNIEDECYLVKLFYLLLYNYEKIPIKNYSKFYLLISLYNETDLSRCFELLICLLNNIENENISEIHILYEMNDKKSIINDLLDFISQKVSFVKIIIIKERPTFDFCFDYCNENIKGKVILSNSDIIYDSTLEKIKHMNSNHFFPITRKNKTLSIEGEIKWEIIKFNKIDDKKNFFSQDTWIFSSPMKYKINNPKCIGSYFCDAIMSYFLSKSKYQCYNLVYDINCYHIQKNTSYSEYINSNIEILKNKIQKNTELFNDHDFAYGLNFTTIDDYYSYKNENLFISFNEWAKTVVVPFIEE